MPQAKLSRPGGSRATDGAKQSNPGATDAPPPFLNFAGSSAADDEVANLGAVSPSNANGDVGAGHYVQVVNSVFQVWNTAGTQELPPTATTDLFEGLGDPCGGTSFNAVDTVIRYDELAGRWILIFVPYDFGFVPPYHLCVAVSASSDPAGAWNGYDFDAGSNLPTRVASGSLAERLLPDVRQPRWLLHGHRRLQRRLRSGRVDRGIRGRHRPRPRLARRVRPGPGGPRRRRDASGRCAEPSGRARPDRLGWQPESRPSHVRVQRGLRRPREQHVRRSVRRLGSRFQPGPLRRHRLQLHSRARRRDLSTPNPAFSWTACSTATWRPASRWSSATR